MHLGFPARQLAIYNYNIRPQAFACPCKGPKEPKLGKPAHASEIVGAHAAAILDNGDVLFGIVPVCKTCNSYSQYGGTYDFRDGVKVNKLAIYAIPLLL
jgi:hypothetical protein